MKLSRVAALALIACTPAFAAPVTVDFEKTWDYANSGVGAYYANGAAADGSTGGADLGVDFVGVFGLSNDANFSYYSGAPSMQGTAYVGDVAFMNVSGGVEGALSFFYSSPTAVTGAIKAYSGANGTGTLLGSFDLAANNSGAYDQWNQVLFSFSGKALSFDLSGSANVVGFDNISTVPEPSSLMLLLGAGVAGLLVKRRRA